MMGEHSVWWLLTMACVVWYCTITVYVTIKVRLISRKCCGDWPTIPMNRPYRSTILRGE